MDHLSGLDAAFLYLETPEQPMHVGGLNIFELPAGYTGEFVNDLRAHITQRMHLAPVFRRKLVNMPFELANPIWAVSTERRITGSNGDCFHQPIEVCLSGFPVA